MPFRLAVFIAIFLSGSVIAKPLTLAGENDFYPYSAEVDGQLVGLVPDLSAAAFQAVGVEVRFRVCPYKRALMLVRSGAVVGGFTGAIDESNEASFFWHATPLSNVRLAIWARSGTGQSGLRPVDMEGHTVSITHGFFYTDAVDNNDAIRKVAAPSDKSTLRMLALGRADFALVTEKIGYSIIQESADFNLKDRVEIVGLVDEVPLHAFFSKEHPQGKEMAELFQTGLEAIIENGEYERILRRWLPEEAIP